SGSRPAASLCAGRTRQAAKRPVSLPLLPSRQVTRRKPGACATAHATTESEAAPGRTLAGREGGRPPPPEGGTSPRSPSAARALGGAGGDHVGVLADATAVPPPLIVRGRGDLGPPAGGAVAHPHAGGAVGLGPPQQRQGDLPLGAVADAFGHARRPEPLGGVA